MGDVIKMPGAVESREMILLKNLPDYLPTFICTGYTDLRKSIPGLSAVVEAYRLDSQAKCLTAFCGRRTDRFKMLMYDGDGYIVMTKRFDFRRLIWPRLGGKDDGELWWVSHEHFESLLNGNKLSVEDIDDGAKMNEPRKNERVNTLARHMLTAKHIPRRFYLHTGYTDLRHSMEKYCDIIREYNLDPEADSVFLFCGKRTDRLRMLYYDGDGYLLISKQLDEGHYTWPRNDNEMWDLMPSQYLDLLMGKQVEREHVLGIFKR